MSFWKVNKPERNMWIMKNEPKFQIKVDDWAMLAASREAPRDLRLLKEVPGCSRTTTALFIRCQLLEKALSKPELFLLFPHGWICQLWKHSSESFQTPLGASLQNVHACLDCSGLFVIITLCFQCLNHCFHGQTSTYRCSLLSVTNQGRFRSLHEPVSF